MQLQKVLICPDSFKGSLDSVRVTEICAYAIKSVFPKVDIVKIPMGDGGEGTLPLVLSLKKGTTVMEDSEDPLGRKISAPYFLFDDGHSAYIESASVLGLPLLSDMERQPALLSSRGLGILIKSALEHGAKKIFVGLGGTATVDGGMGMLDILGWTFYDGSGRRLSGKGEDLLKVRSIIPPFSPLTEEIKFYAVCDVCNPLTGKNGAVRIFGPQKGLSGKQLESMEEGMKNFALVSSEVLGVDCYDKEGSGAAGGIGYSMFSFLKAERVGGSDFIMDLFRFDQELQGCDLVITGEGRIDSQSLMGKVTGTVLKRSLLRGVPVIVFAGDVKDRDLLNQAGFLSVYSIQNGVIDEKSAMLPEVASFNLYESVLQVMKTIKWALA